MKILIIGGGGQLGAKILAQARDAHSLYATYMTRKPALKDARTFLVDKGDKKAVHDLIRRLNPDAVIDTAAIHNVDYCETQKEEAYRVNVEGTRNIAEICGSMGAKMSRLTTSCRSAQISK